MTAALDLLNARHEHDEAAYHEAWLHGASAVDALLSAFLAHDDALRLVTAERDWWRARHVVGAEAGLVASLDYEATEFAHDALAGVPVDGPPPPPQEAT